VGTIDASGKFVGKSNGTTNVVATFNTFSDTSVIHVESAAGLVNLDPLESLDGWTITGEHLDSLSVVLATDQQTFGSASFQIGYKFTYDAATSPYMVYLQKPTRLYGIPDSIYLDARSDGRLHRLYYRFSDAEGGAFRGIAKRFMNSSTSFSMINTPMTGLAPLTSVTTETYPLTLERIEIQLAGETVQGRSTSGTIYVDNLRLKYPGSVTGVETKPLSPEAFALEQNYPNPFNPTTVVGYRVGGYGDQGSGTGDWGSVQGSESRVSNPGSRISSHVSLRIYDLLGREVAVLVNEEKAAGIYTARWDASGMPSGIYFYRLTSGEFAQTRKLVLMK
jgi:hypothetical protein